MRPLENLSPEVSGAIYATGTVLLFVAASGYPLSLVAGAFALVCLLPLAIAQAAT
jgi:hypothetical protein